jgi:hypothetical protein
MPSLIGNKPNQVPSNGDLGTLAFQDSNAVNIVGGTAVVDNLTADSINLKVDSDLTNISPSLLLDFANTKALDPRITFTRASTASFYDGRTTAKAEENLLLQTVDMANALYSQTVAGVASTPTKTSNHGVAPDGTTTAARYQLSLNGGTATADYAGFVQGYSFGAAVTATYSVWIKSTDGTSTYDAQIIAPTALGSAVAITGAWQRFTVTGTSLATSVAYGIRLRGGQTPTNSNTADILVWGAQLEQRSAVSAYTPTTTAPITNYIPALRTAQAGQARFDHAPLTGESLGLLIEEQRTNLVLYSDDFSNAVWAKTRSSISSNTIVSPDGTLTGDKLVEDTSATMTHPLTTPFTPASATTFTYSVYLKAAERTWAAIQFDSLVTYFDLTNGVLGTVASGITASITPVGNGWFRCSVTRTFTSTSATTIFHYPATANNTISYTGNGFAGLFIWGAQLEAGAFATSYIPTVASQVTRSSDAASMTGLNFSSWFNNAEGTLYGEASTPSTLVTVNIEDNSGNNFIGIRHRAVSGEFGRVVDNSIAQASFTSTFTSNSKVVIAYKVNDFAGSVNSALPLTDSSGVVPVVSRALIGATASAVFNGTIKKLAYYPVRLPNAELQEMTS